MSLEQNESIVSWAMSARSVTRIACPSGHHGEKHGRSEEATVSELCSDYVRFFRLATGYQTDSSARTLLLRLYKAVK